MKVTVKLFGNLRRHLPRTQELLELDLVEGVRINEVLEQLGIDDGEVGLAVVNGELVAETSQLHDGDRLELFAVIGGGA